jgi:hypothetical protein
MADAMRMADMLAKSTMVPRNYQGKPGDVLIAIQWGHELGLAPLQALQSIASINGRPSVWGDAAMALCVAHPACEYVREEMTGEGDAMVAICRAKRRGQAEQVRRFSVADARRAKLWGKAGPWTDYPQRMLQMRARGFALRDVFPDALRGVITAEEAQDMPAEAAPSERVVGLVVPNQPLLAQMQAPADTALPLIGPDGTRYDITAKGDRPAVMIWMSAARKAIARMESLEALRGWREAMGPHLVTISETEPEAVEAVERAITAREDALSVVDEGETQENAE